VSEVDILPEDSNNERFHYDGFSSPNGTIVPDDVFDVLMPRLTDPELRVLLYIIRRTFGFKKHSDNISLKQMVEGIRTRDGTVLDGGTGMSKASVARGLKGLSQKDIITAVHNSSRERGNEPTTYSLRFKQGPLSQPETRGVSQIETGGGLSLRQALVSPVDPQQTVKQQTEISLSNVRKADITTEMLLGNSEQSENASRRVFTSVGEKLDQCPGARKCGEITVDPDRATIVDYIEDFSREFSDRAPLKSSATRAYNLYQTSGLSLDTFIEGLYRARSVVKERSGSIRSTTMPATSGTAAKNKMAYFFAVLEDLLGLREDGAPTNR